MKNFITQEKPYGFYGMKALTLMRWCFGLIFLLTGLSSYGQVATNRTFSQSTGTYTPITGGTVLVTQTNNTTSNAGSLDDGATYLVTLPFSFSYDGTAYTEMTVTNNMSVSFGGTPILDDIYSPISGTDVYAAAIAAYGRDMQGGYVFSATSVNGSPVLTLTGGANTAGVTVGSVISGTGIPTATTVVSFDATTVTMSANATSNSTGTARWVWNGEMRHETLGSPGNQIFVVQWSNMKPFGTSLTNVNSFRMNAQLRLHEATGLIEVVYGDCTPGLATSTTGAQVGLRGPDNTFATNVNNRLVTKNVHDWATSVAGTANSSSLVFNNTATANVIPSGLTYSWSEPTTDEMDYNNIQWLTDGSTGSNTSYTALAGTTLTAYAQGYEAGVTEAAGAGAGVEAWIGYNTVDSNPSLPDWTWVAATFNAQDGNNDEFQANLPALPAGTYYVASRWRLNSGPFTYGDNAGNWGGGDNITLTINPNPTQCATDPVPASGATEVTPGTIALSWTAPTTGPAPTSYELWTGVTSGSLTLLTTVATTTVNVTADAFNTQLFWQIRPVSVAGGTATGCPEWNFTTDAAPQGTFCADPVVVTPGAHVIGAVNIGGGFVASTGCTTNFSTSNNGSHARWFSYTPAVDGIMRVKSCSPVAPLVDTRLSVFTGADCAALTCVGTDDDDDDYDCHADDGYSSTVSASVTGGTTYLIQWDSNWSTASTNWTLDFQQLGATVNQATGAINFTEAFPITGDLTLAGLTDSDGAGAGVTASIGMSFTDTDPSTWANSYSWRSIAYNSDNIAADEYSGNIGPNYQDGMGNDVWYWSPGVYYYATRFNDGVNDYYGGTTGPWNNNNGKLKISTQVRSSQDGLTYTDLTTPINAVTAVDATLYTFEFRDNADDSLVGEYTNTTPVINFSALGVDATNRTYKIRVKADLMGMETIDYGTTITITLNNTVGLPQLRPSQCGLVVPANNASVVLNALSVSGASMYEFGITINGGTEQVISSVTGVMNFGALSSLPSSSSIISVRVRAESSGIWTGWGSSCNLTTPTQITQVRLSQCGITVPADNATVVVNAISVTNATNYEFEVTVNGGTPEMISTANSYFSFSQLSALPSMAATVAIRVRATVNGIVGNWGNSCNVFTPAVMDEEIIDNGYSSEKISAYPNPFSNQFTLKLANNTEATIQIFDINGRLVSNQLVNDSYEVELGQNLTSGVYLVRVEQNNESTSLKMIKK